MVLLFRIKQEVRFSELHLTPWNCDDQYGQGDSLKPLCTAGVQIGAIMSQ